MATIDTSIYQNLLRPPKTVSEYDAEAMANQQNRLTLQVGQMKADEYTRGLADQNKLRQVVAGFGTDQAANQNMLLKAGRLTEAQAYAKSNADIGKAAADTKYTEAQTAEKHVQAVNLKMGQARDMFNTITTPEQAAQLVRGMYADPDLGKLFAMKGDTAEAAVSRIPTDPALFAQWVQAASLNAEKLATYRTPDANTVASNTQSNVNSQRTAASSKYSADSSAASSRYSTDRSAASAAQRLAFDKSKPKDGAGKPMPPTALKMQQTELDAIGIASSIQADLGAIEQQIKGGKLNFGPVNNLLNKGRNMAGMSNEESRNMASFRSTLEKLRNDSLRLNVGIQTDGDAQREWAALFENINDKGVVTQRLAEIKRINARAVQLRRMNVDGIRSNYGRDPLDTAKYEDQPAAIGKSAIPSGWSVKER